MGAGCGDLQRALGVLLAPDVHQVRSAGVDALGAIRRRVPSRDCIWPVVAALLPEGGRRALRASCGDDHHLRRPRPLRRPARGRRLSRTFVSSDSYHGQNAIGVPDSTSRDSLRRSIADSGVAGTEEDRDGDQQVVRRPHHSLVDQREVRHRSRARPSQTKAGCL